MIPAICLVAEVQIIALDVENSVPASAIILERDLRAQLHQLFFGKLLSQTRIQIVRDIRWRISHRVSQLDDEALLSSNDVRSSLSTARNLSSLRPAFLPTAELTSIQKGQPTRDAARTFPS